MNPLVSIIIPTFNRAHLLGETLDSVLAQTYQNWECIIVDDSSTDYTSELLEFYISNDPRIRYYSKPAFLPEGANACRNYGSTLASGIYIQWFDSDDLFAPDCLQRKIEVINTSGADICICNALHFDKNPEKPFHVFKNNCKDNDLLSSYITGKVNINTPVVLWKKEVVQDESFNENLYRAQELDFHFRVFKKKKLDVVFLDSELVLIRGHKDSITGKFKSGELKYIKSDLQVRREILVYMNCNNYSKKEKEAGVRLYINSLRALSKYSNLFQLLRELRALESKCKLPFDYQFWKYNLIKWVIVYKVTGREYQLKKHLFSLPF